MTKVISIIIFTCFAASFTVSAQIFNDRQIIADTTHPPIIDVIPNNIVVPNDTSRFYEKDISFINRGGSVLTITKVSASCFCSNGVILKNNIYTLEKGEIRLDINKEGLKDGDDTVVFIIESNAQNNPFSINVKFVDPDEESNGSDDDELPKNP